VQQLFDFHCDFAAAALVRQFVRLLELRSGSWQTLGAGTLWSGLGGDHADLQTGLCPLSSTMLAK